MTIEEMKLRKAELGYSYEQISNLSGLPLGTVQKVLGGVTKSPRYDTLKALEAVFLPANQGDRIKEEGLDYHGYRTKQQGEYTVEDYLAWPEDERIELIDGVIYDMASPTDVHQIVAGLLHASFLNYIRKKKGSCIPVISPIDVQLDKDDKTMVQPDVVIICDRSKFKNGRIYGAPDFIVEVLSPSTRKKDMKKKLSKYLAAGVREYWMIDLKEKKVIVHADKGEEDSDIAVYTFEHKVPVRIFDNDCEVDFKEVEEYISFLYE